MGFFDKIGSFASKAASFATNVQSIQSILDPPKVPVFQNQPQQQQPTFGPPVTPPFGSPGSIFQFPGLPPAQFPTHPGGPILIGDEIEEAKEKSANAIMLVGVGVAAGVIVWFLTRK